MPDIKSTFAAIAVIDALNSVSDDIEATLTPDEKAEFDRYDVFAAAAEPQLNAILAGASHSDAVSLLLAHATPHLAALPQDNRRQMVLAFAQMSELLASTGAFA